MTSKTLFHATTPKKVQKYHQSGKINTPVCGFTTLVQRFSTKMLWTDEAAMAFSLKYCPSTKNKNYALQY